METKNSWVPVTDFQFPNGWQNQAAERARSCCEQLENGDILFLDGIPFDFPETDREFLLSQRQSDSGLHKNISYRPKQDLLRGSAAGKEDFKRLHDIMRRYSKAVVNFLSQALSPYAGKWSLDFASFRPEEEKGRDLPLHKRNDLLHLDSFPTRPTHGGRILRCFTNINPTDPRIWLTTDRLPVLAQNFARRAGLEQFATRRRSSFSPLITGFKKAVGMKTVEHSAYDKFMLRFHDYLKENSEFQKNCPKIRLEFPPVSTWMCYTDSVPHAVLSGQYALEQTFIVPINAMVAPEKSPLRILEKMAGRPLAEGKN